MPLLFVSTDSNNKRLATTSYNKFMPKLMKLFAIVSFQPDVLTIDRHSILNMVSIDHATFPPGNGPPTNAFERIPV